MFVYMNLHAENAKPPCFRLAVIFIKKEGVSQVLNMSQPAAYVPDAPCVRPFRSEYSIAANAKSSVWQNIMSKGQYIGQWISSRRNSVDKIPTAV